MLTYLLTYSPLECHWMGDFVYCIWPWRWFTVKRRKRRTGLHAIIADLFLLTALRVCLRFVRGLCFHISLDYCNAVLASQLIIPHDTGVSGQGRLQTLSSSLQFHKTLCTVLTYWRTVLTRSSSSLHTQVVLVVALVERWTRDRKVACSTPVRGAIKSTRSTQPSIPLG